MPYVARLKQLEIELTKANRLSEAKDVMDYREGMAAGMPAKVEVAASTTAGSSRPVGSPGESLLAMENRKKWKEVKGDWKFQNGALLGTGDSEMDYHTSIPMPFVLHFSINVLEGTRPRVRIGGLTFANEGYDKTFGLYPDGKATLFNYQHKTKYTVALKVDHKTVELFIDDKLISTVPGIKKRPEFIGFSAGDNWSKGEVEYSDIFISH